MMKNYPLIVFLVESCRLFSQVICLLMGSNFTKRVFKRLMETMTTQFQNGTDFNYLIGYSIPFNINK